MLRLAGALMVAGGMSTLGFLAAGGLGRRVRTLRALAGALELMERELSFRDFEVLPGGAIRLYEGLEAPQRITNLLVSQGISLYGMEHRGANLEDYFLNLIGGVHHG